LTLENTEFQHGQGVVVRQRSFWVAARRLLVALSLFLATGAGVLIFGDAVKQPLSRVCATAALEPNPVAAENTCPGSTGWQWSGDAPGPTDIEGFVTPASVNSGNTIRLFVTTTASTYTFKIFRLGWYSGFGGRLMYASPVEQGIAQPAPTIDPQTRTVRCDTWKGGPTVAIPGSWVSGMYLIKFYSSDGHSRYTSLVVRDDASQAPIGFQASLLTYQAYNLWGGYSLYFGINPATHIVDSAHRAYIVSFDRPYDSHEGLGDFPRSEFNLVRWLERESYNVTYFSDMDVHASVNPLQGRRLLIVGGHDEYWSTAMREHVTLARDAGTSLAFFSANNVYWHVRIQDSPLGANREVICYKNAQLDPVYRTQPLETSTRWRDPPLNNPENGLLGEMYRGSAESGTIASLVIGPGARPFLAGTGLAIGSSIPGVVGGEYDNINDNMSETDLNAYSLTVLSASPLRCERGTSSCPIDGSGSNISNATIYRMTNGAKVFDAGTFYWSWGLDDKLFDGYRPTAGGSSRGFQRFTANILAYLLIRG
jgi:N,N-dimethylformamidase beta subunit-like protein